jgi:hypothetical protein
MKAEVECLPPFDFTIHPSFMEPLVILVISIDDMHRNGEWAPLVEEPAEDALAETKVPDLDRRSDPPSVLCFSARIVHLVQVAVAIAENEDQHDQRLRCSGVGRKGII